LFMANRKSIWQAKKTAIVGLPNMWQKRRQIQSTRTASIGSFARLLNWNPFSPFVKLINRHPYRKEQHD